MFRLPRVSSLLAFGLSLSFALERLSGDRMILGFLNLIRGELRGDVAHN